MAKKKAIILFSGGLDSSTCLAIAQHQAYDCYTLSFDYQQRHRAELAAAANIAQTMRVIEHRVMPLPIAELKGSSLTDTSLEVPDYQASDEIPNTYVPARNTIFLSFAIAWAEVLGAEAIYYGANAIDYSNYADCRPDYVKAMQKVANLATRSGVNGLAVSIETPLLQLSKAEIIQLGVKLGVDYSLTVSCYRLSKESLACGQCDACHFRRQGFIAADIEDPTRYIPR